MPARVFIMFKVPGRHYATGLALKIARRIGIRQSLLASYIKGTKTPSEQRKQEILSAIHDVGRALVQVRF